MFPTGVHFLCGKICRYVILTHMDNHVFEIVFTILTNSYMKGFAT